MTLDDNPYRVYARSDAPSKVRRSEKAGGCLTILPLVPIVFFFAFATMFFLSTRFYWEGRVPEKEAKEWIWFWLPKSAICLVVSVFTAFASFTIEPSRKTAAVLILCASPLLLLTWIVINRLFF
jgi:hypothetical protein